MIKGSIDKDSKYRRTILSAVEMDINHPIHNGIDMQAHHLISSKGVKDSELGMQLVRMGYNINNLKNLVLLTCTLKGACHLGVQLHRGNHSFHDDDHPRSYHKEVTDRIKSLEEELDGKCTLDKPIHGLLNKESAKLLNMIKRYKIPLTRIYKSFNTLGGLSCVGCSNSNSIPEHNERIKCNSNRVHFHTIMHKPYNLKVGK